MGIREVGDKEACHSMPKPRINGGEGSFHFVVDDSLEEKWAIHIFGITEGEVVSFLQKALFFEERVKGGVEVDLEEVVKVFLHLGRCRVAGEVAPCHCVHESVEAPPTH